MSRIRTIKPEFFISEQVADCSPIARLLFVGLWVFGDDNGIHPASPRRIKAEVFPHDDMAAETVRTMLDELEAAGLVDRFSDPAGDEYLRVTGWHRHQSIEKPRFRYPVPSYCEQDAAGRIIGEGSARRGRNVADKSTTSRRQVAEASGLESNGVESNGREGRESPRARSATQSRNGAAAPASSAMTLSADLKIPEGWEAAAAEHRDAARLRPVKLGAEWAKFCAVNDGVTMRNARSAWLKWALGTRAELQEHDQAPREVNGEEHTVVIDPWPQRLAGYAKSPKSWNAMRGHWGPTPDEPGCKAPAEQLQAFRREHRKEPVA